MADKIHVGLVAANSQLEYVNQNDWVLLLDKENEITTAKGDAEWISMSVDEIHARTFGGTAIATGLLSAQGKRTDGTTFSARVRFLAALVKHDGVWQLVATQSTPINPRNMARIVEQR